MVFEIDPGLSELRRRKNLLLFRRKSARLCYPFSYMQMKATRGMVKMQATNVTTAIPVA